MYFLNVLCWLSVTTIYAFFVPICKWSDARTAKANVFHVNGVEVVVMKPSYNEVVAFTDNCPHRGASFQDARVENSSLICNYHAFHFNLPSGILESGIGTTANCTRLTNVPVIRRGNLIWGCVDGGLQMPPPFESDELIDDFRTIHGSTIIRCQSNMLVDNVIDVIHTNYVHSFGNPADPEPRNYSVTKDTDRRSTAIFNYHAGNTSLFSNSDVRVENWFYTPCTAATRVIRNKDVKMVQVHAVQRSESTCQVYYSLTRNFWTWPILDYFFQIAMAITLDEDRRILESVNYQAGNKMNTKYDALQLHFRRAKNKALNDNKNKS
jgi:phenylpropionate dioxygenase-like ring-hydroxylating dioxygenase large terminal subunit